MPRTMEEATDAPERKVIADIAEVGWHIINVMEGEDTPGFSFTIGLETTFHHPELLMIGQRSELAAFVLNNLGEDIKNGQRFAHGDKSTEVFDDYICLFIEVDRRHYGEYLGFATWWHRGGNFRTLQVVWPDLDHRLPWDEGSDAAELEPVLGPIPR